MSEQEQAESVEEGSLVSNAKPFRLWVVILLSVALGLLIGTCKIWIDSNGIDAYFWCIYVGGGMLWIGLTFAMVIWHKWRFGLWVIFVIATIYCLMIVVVQVAGEQSFALVGIGFLMLWGFTIGFMANLKMIA